MMKTIGVMAAAVVAASRVWAADPLAAIAKDFGAAALEAHIERVAVLPFEDPEASGDGRGVAEALITRLVRAGKVKLVERGQMSRLLEEQGLAAKGAVRGEAPRVGELASAQAIVTGTLVARGGRLVAHARLVELESGRIVAARSEKLGAAREPAAFAGEARLAPPTPPAPAPWAAKPDDLRDAPAPDCRNSRQKAAILRSIGLPLKARYWAGRLREPGYVPGTLEREAPEEPVLRDRLVELVKEAYLRGAPPLSEDERTSARRADERIRRLLSCDHGG